MAGKPSPVVISETSKGLPWRHTVDQLHTREADDDIPTWVKECILYNRLPSQRDMKCAFVLQPAEGSQLPAMLQARLNAPRILRIAKVASYTVSKLAEQNIAMVVLPPKWDAAAHGLGPVLAPVSSGRDALGSLANLALASSSHRL